MKKSKTIVLSFLMIFAMIFGLSGCGEEQIMFANKTVNGLSFDVPKDFGEFKEKQGIMVASNEESTASIAVSGTGDATGYAVEDWTQDSYKQATLPSYDDVKFIEFNKEATVSGFPAVYAHFTATNPNGAEVEAYNYIIYLPEEDGVPVFQSITFSYNKSAGTSLQESIDEVKSSLKL